MKQISELKKICLEIAETDNREAFSIFYKAYHSKLIRFALLFVSSYDSAEEVVSESMIRLLRKKSKLFSMDNFEGYLFMTIKNEAINFNKKRKRGYCTQTLDIEKDFLTETYNVPLKQMLDKELRDWLTKAIESLPPRRRLVFKLIKDDGLKYKEVAKLMDISIKTVENHLDHAMKTIKQSLEEYNETKAKDSGLLKVTKSICS